MRRRDLTKKQFEAALTKAGFEREQYPVLGYWRYLNWNVSRLNCRGSYRSKLAYMLQRKARIDKYMSEENVKKKFLTLEPLV